METEHRCPRMVFLWLAVDLDGFAGYFASSGAESVPHLSVEAGELVPTYLDKINRCGRRPGSC
jgi:hypothetical protein